jgi:hypothetical protein
MATDPAKQKGGSSPTASSEAEPGLLHLLFGGLFSSLYKVTQNQGWSNPILILLFIGLLILIGYGWARGSGGIPVALLTAGGSMAVGAILGFLFGIPRSVQEGRQQANPADKDQPIYQTNTNLEQISDWLTKIIVGLGLAQLFQAPTALMSLNEYLANAFGEQAVPPSVVGLILAYFSIGGFLISYLWTRIYLTGEFTRADRAARQSPEFYEGLIHALLYQPPPEGFKQAIVEAKEFLRRFGESNWRVWRSLACAYGQQHRFLKGSSGSPEDIKTARDHALSAVKKVLELNPSEKDSMAGLWDPAQATPQENDLVDFYTDDEFKALLN